MPLGSLKSKRMPPGATQKCDACLELAILEFFRPDSSRRSKSGHSSVFFKSSFDYSSGNMAVACTIRRNKRSFYRRVHVDKLATPHSLDLMNVISRLYGDTMPLTTPISTTQQFLCQRVRASSSIAKINEVLLIC